MKKTNGSISRLKSMIVAPSIVPDNVLATRAVLVLAGAFHAVLAVLFLLTRPPYYEAVRRLIGENPATLEAKLAVPAGLCTLAAGVWIAKRMKSWLLVLGGLAFSAYALIPEILPLSFYPFFALLLVTMTLSIGILALTKARNDEIRVSGKWLLRLAGAGSVGLALALLIWDWAVRWFCLPGLLALLLAALFGFTAVSIFGLAFRLTTRPAVVRTLPDEFCLD